MSSIRFPLNMADPLKILQINVNHSYSAIEHLKITIAQIQPNIIALQEPYYHNDKIIGFSLNEIIIQHSEQPRSAMIVRGGNIDAFPEKVQRDLISLRVTFNKECLRVVNVYNPPNDDIEIILDQLEEIVTTYDPLPTVILGDFNAKHQAWGGKHSDDNGDKVTQFLINHSLHILNDKDQGPTFESRRGSSFIDLTLVNHSFFREVMEWKILENHSESDHKYILTTCFHSYSQPKKRLTVKGELKLLETLAQDRWIASLRDIEISSVTQLETIIHRLYDKINAWIQKFSRIVPYEKKSLKWWTPDLEVERKKVGALRRRYQKTSNNTRGIQKVKYKHALVEYKKHIAAAKETSWQNFCTEVTQANIFSLPYKLALKKIKKPTLIRPITQPDGTQTQSLESSIKNILAYHFPDDDPESYSNYQKEVLQSLQTAMHGENDLDFTIPELERVVAQLARRVTPGTDQLTPQMVKTLCNAHAPSILKLFNACLRYGFFPSQWRESRVVLLTKQEKPSNEAKSFRPICISSLFGKLLEKLLNNRIYYFLYNNNLLHPNQFGFTHGKSATLALYHLKRNIETNMEEGRKNVLISLDISNAFNSIWLPFLFHYFHSHELPLNLYNLLKAVFNHRSVTYSTNTTHLVKQATMGCPQGSPISPLMWNVLISSLLEISFPEGAQLQAFADDVVILISGKTRLQLELLARKTLEMIQTWSINHRVRFNPEKSKFLLIGKDYKKRPPTIKLGSVSIPSVPELKILGVVFDGNLTFLPHLQYVQKKVAQSTLALSAYSGLHWGYNPHQFRQLYLRSIEKIITYGCPIYYKFEKNSHQLRKLKTVQRIPLLKITKAFRTVPNDSLNILARVLPIHLTIEKEFHMFKLFQLKNDDTIEGERVEVTDLDYPIDLRALHPSACLAYPYKPMPLMERQVDYEVYTDGSVQKEAVGAAFVVMKPTMEVLQVGKYRLPPHATIYDAELEAIQKALDFLQTLKEPSKIILITDSLSSLQAIANPNNTNRQVYNIKLTIKELLTKQSLILQHVKSHNNNIGNDYADKLAKQARTEGQLADRPRSKKNVKQYIVSLLYEKWNTTWMTMGKDSSLFQWIPTPKNIPDYFPSDFLLTQLLTNHGRFPFYFFKFNKQPHSDCPCGEMALDFSHYVLNCPLTLSERNQISALQVNDLSTETKRKIINNESIIRILTTMVAKISSHIEQL